MVEFCIGLIAMLTVIAGIFQLGRLGLARTRARVEATRFATARGMLPATSLSVPRYIHRLSASGDERTYSEDDTAIGGDAREAYDRLLAPNQPDRLRLYASGNELAEIDDAFEMMLGMGLVQGIGTELNIPVMPIVRRLFFDEDSVDIQVNVWSVRTGDLY